jgi:hypothetical protein
LESFKLECRRDTEDLPKQIRAMVQQVMGEARGKCENEAGGANATIPSTPATHGTSASMARTGNQGGIANPNFQQPFYQAYAYGSNMQTPPDTDFARPPTIPLATDGAHLGMSENVREHIARTLREFGLEPKGRVRTYQKQYPEILDTIPYPRGFWVPEFVKFTRDDSKTTYEHIG